MMMMITGCISYLPLIVIVNTIAECLRTDCNILGDKKILEDKLRVRPSLLEMALNLY